MTLCDWIHNLGVVRGSSPTEYPKQHEGSFAPPSPARLQLLGPWEQDRRGPRVNRGLLPLRTGAHERGPITDLLDGHSASCGEEGAVRPMPAARRGNSGHGTLTCRSNQSSGEQPSLRGDCISRCTRRRPRSGQQRRSPATGFASRHRPTGTVPSDGANTSACFVMDAEDGRLPAGWVRSMGTTQELRKGKKCADGHCSS